MRAIANPVKTYSVTLGSSVQDQTEVVLPGFGALSGIILELKVSLSGATDSETSNTIDNVISSIRLTDKAGDTIFDLKGTDLYLLQQVLSPTGQLQTPAGVTTSATGSGSQEYNLFIPQTIAAADMNAKLAITFAALSSLENTNMTSAGTATVTLNVRVLNTSAAVQTLRVKASDIATTVGDVEYGPFLPQGNEEIALAVYANGSTVAHATLQTAGAALVQRQTETAFKVEDELFLQGFHYTGMLIFRVPVFHVDSTTVFTINYSAVVTANSLALSFSVKPQKRT